MVREGPSKFFFCKATSKLDQSRVGTTNQMNEQFVSRLQSPQRVHSGRGLRARSNDSVADGWFDGQPSIALTSGKVFASLVLVETRHVVVVFFDARQHVNRLDCVVVAVETEAKERAQFNRYFEIRHKSEKQFSIDINQ